MSKLNKSIQCKLCGENIPPGMYVQHMKELCPKIHQKGRGRIVSSLPLLDHPVNDGQVVPSPPPHSNNANGGQLEVCPYCQAFVSTQWLDDHIQKRCSFKFIKSSGKSIIESISGLVWCPRCSRETKLLWLSKHTPLCINCIANISNEKVLFLPTVVQGTNDHWIVISRIKIADYTKQLLYYIDECITIIEQKRVSKKYTTRDKKTLLELIDILLSEYILSHKISRKKDYHSTQLLEEQKASVKKLRDRIKTFSNERMNEINTPRVISEDEKEEITINELSWQILPPGKHPFPRIISHYEQILHSNPTVTFDKNRLYKINSLGPSAIYKGQGEFLDYIAFEFQDKQVAVLENPIFGNAIYVIRGDWKKLSKLSKSDLLWNHSNNTTRIIHKGDWFVRLKQELDF